MQVKSQLDELTNSHHSEDNKVVNIRLFYRELLRVNSTHTRVIIDALTNLTLSSQLRTHVREKMLSRLDKCPHEYLPVLVQFIITRCDTSELPQVIVNISYIYISLCIMCYTASNKTFRSLRAFAGICRSLCNITN